MADKHSAGPWEYVPKLTASENHQGFFVRAEKPTKDGKWALAMVQPGDEDGKLGEANARLIAAAPDMANALRSLLRHAERVNEVLAQECGVRFVDDGPLGMARDALRKAAGAA